MQKKGNIAAHRQRILLANSCLSSCLKQRAIPMVQIRNHGHLALCNLRGPFLRNWKKFWVW